MDTLLTLLITGISIGAIYAPLALGLTMTFNVTGVLNLSQGEFFMLAPFVSLFLIESLGLPLLVASALTIVVMGVLGAAVYAVTLALVPRASGDTQILITLGTAIVLAGVALLVFGPDPRSVPAFSGLAPIDVLGVPLSRQYLWIVGATVTLLIAIWTFFTRSPYGIAMRASSDNAAAAQVLGLSTRRFGIIAFGIAGLLGGVAGLVAAPVTLADVNIGLVVLLKGFIAAVVGGWGSYVGAVVGALALGLTEAVAATYLPTLYGEAFVVGLLVVILLVRPAGIVSLAVRRTA